MNVFWVREDGLQRTIQIAIKSVFYKGIFYKTYFILRTIKMAVAKQDSVFAAAIGVLGFFCVIIWLIGHSAFK